MKLSNNIHSDFGLSYKTVMNNQSCPSRSGITQPHQFSLGNIPTMSGITDSIGEGCNERKITIFFNERNNFVNGQEEAPMTTSKHFERAYITLSTMTKIKLTTKKRKGYLFTNECYMPSFEPQNKTVHNQHATMFKHDKFTSHPQKDLVRSMPYQFVANLEPGQFTPLDVQWLKKLKNFFKKAKLNSIKQIRLVRLLKTNNVGNRTITFKISNEDVIYEAVTDTNDSSYLVTLDQIYDIVGEEDWIHGESNCLVNLASSPTITLSWRAKKKECIDQRRVLSDEGLQVGDHVVVENHGNQWAHQAQIIDIDMDEGLQVGDEVIVENHCKYWPHKAQIIDIDMETNIALIRCETTQKMNLVHLKDLK